MNVPDITETRLSTHSIFTAFAVLLGISLHAAGDVTWEQIRQQSGVRGGLVVHLGCGEGELTATLGAADAYIVHGLDK
ncbi:MAG: hypothetical protein JSW47_20705, partial [Phycisphaerales bacterium]